MTEFFQDYWLYLTLVLGVVLLLTVGYIAYSVVSKKKLSQQKNHHRTDKKREEPEIKISLKDLVKDELSPVERSISDPQVSTNPLPIKETAIAVFPEEEAKPASYSSPSEPANPDPIFKEPLPTPISLEPTPKPQKEKKALGRYHVLYRKDDGQWYVKRENSERILRVLPTQREAIAFATIKAITQNTSFVIHRQDGKIRK